MDEFQPVIGQSYVCILRGKETTSGLQQPGGGDALKQLISMCPSKKKQSKRKGRIETNAKAFGLTAGQTAAAAQLELVSRCPEE